MLFLSLLAFDFIAFFLWLVIPLGLHVLFLPLSFAHSKELGLSTALFWASYYCLEALFSKTFLKPVFKTLLNPIVAFLPVLQHLHLIPPLPLISLFQSPTFLSLFEYGLLSLLPFLAILEAIATVLLIKRLGAFLKHSEISEWAKWGFLIFLVSAYLYSLSEWYSLHVNQVFEGYGSLFATLIFILSHIIIFMIPHIAVPGEHDVPMAEGFFLFFYVTYCVSLFGKHIPQALPKLASIPLLYTPGPHGYMYYLNYIRPSIIKAQLALWANWCAQVLTWFPSIWLVKLIYRTFVFSAVTHILTGRLRSHQTNYSSLKTWVVYLNIFYKPVLIMYYAYTLLFLFGWVSDISYGMHWLSLITSMVFFVVLLSI